MAKKPKSVPPPMNSPSGAPAHEVVKDPSVRLPPEVHHVPGEAPSVPTPVIVIEPMSVELERDEIAQALAAEAFGQIAIDSRPNISHLEDAVALVGGERVPLFDVGDRIVVERTYERFGVRTWLDTNVYEVLYIDDETGTLRLYNHELSQHAMSAFKGAGAEGSLLIKLANEVGGMEVRAKRRRGRPRKNPALKKAETPAGEKRRRGRPPGSKNRSKEVIKAEKEAKRNVLLERRAKRRACK